MLAVNESRRDQPTFVALICGKDETGQVQTRCGRRKQCPDVNRLDVGRPPLRHGLGVQGLHHTSSGRITGGAEADLASGWYGM